MRSPASRPACASTSPARPAPGGRCAPRTSTTASAPSPAWPPATSTAIKPFTALVDQVMTTEPYASARRVFWIVDSGASHRNWAAAARLSDAYPSAQMVHLPVHASWLNQAGVYFSVLQRKLLTPDDFEGPDELEEQIPAFEQHYNATARPF